MVTMNSEKSACCRKAGESSDISGTTERQRHRDNQRNQCNNQNGETIDKCQSSLTYHITASCAEDTPNYLVFQKMEAIVEKMSDEVSGVPVKTVKSFMTKTPSVFTGTDLISWMMKTMAIDDQGITEMLKTIVDKSNAVNFLFLTLYDQGRQKIITPTITLLAKNKALHVAHLMASHGYFFPIDDHCLTVRNDNTFYRFQTPYFWPSNCWEPENTDYAVYLCKRTMQNKTRLELADYEAENLAKLQKIFSRKWEFIFMQAEAQSKVDKKRDKLERKVLDSQERAFWDVYRPMPGCVNTTELDIKKACRSCKSTSESSQPGSKETRSVETLRKEIEVLNSILDRLNTKVSKVSEALIGYFEQYVEYDPFFTQPEFTNPWVSDSPEMWEQEKLAKEVTTRRVKRWAFSLQELLQDPVGRDQFTRFLDKEFSGENLKFWEAVQELKTLPQKEIQTKINEIWNEYLGPDASCPINVDSQSYEITKKNMQKPDRWCFDVAAAHVYHLMKSDSYSRYLRSEMYKDFLNGSKKKTSVKGIRSIVSFSGRRDTAIS